MEDVAVTVTHGGYLKRTSVDTYRRQSRGGKGRIGMGTRTEDFLEHLIVASTHSYLLIFTDKGRVYWLKIYEIPDAATVGKGKHVSNLINLQPDDTVKAFLAVREFVPDRYIVMSTKHGVIRKCELTEFDHPISRGIIAVKLDEGDELISVHLTNGENFIFLGSHDGPGHPLCREPSAFHRTGHSRRAGHGPGCRRPPGRHGDCRRGRPYLVDLGEWFSASAPGLTDYRLQSRGGKGVINMKTSTSQRQGGGYPVGEGRYRPDDCYEER